MMSNKKLNKMFFGCFFDPECASCRYSCENNTDYPDCVFKPLYEICRLLKCEGNGKCSKMEYVFDTTGFNCFLTPNVGFRKAVPLLLDLTHPDI